MSLESDCKHALIIHGGALGDFVMTLRVVAALRMSGATHIGFMGRSEFMDLANRGGVDEFIDLHTGGCHALFSEHALLPPEFSDRLAKFTLVVDMLAGPESPLPRRFGRLGVPRVLAIDPRPRPGWSGHVSDQWLDDLRIAGVNANAGLPRIECDRGLVAAARDELLEATATKGRIALIHPGSGSPTKCWPIDSFLQVIHSLRAANWGVVVLIGPVELERLAPADLARLRCAAPTVENRPLNLFADLLAASDLFIGNDSGVSHLAAALGVPMVAIFGPTPPAIWRPLGPCVTVVAGTPAAWPAPMDILAAIRTISQLASP